MIFKIAKKLLLRAGYRLEQTAKPSDILKTIRMIQPVAVGYDLIRIGGEGDGGYLIPDDLEGVKYCFSPGVDQTADFEKKLAETYAIPSFLADYSVDAAPTANALFDFERKYIGITNDDVNMRLEDWVNDKVGHDPNADLMLQMDIEGSEFSVIIDTPIEVLKKFRIMVVEFHGMDVMFEKGGLKQMSHVFGKLKQDFCVAHIHPNNCNTCKTFKCGDIVIPKVFEVTFFRKDRVKPDTRTLTFPHPLDRKNVPYNPDNILPEIWYKPIA